MNHSMTTMTHHRFSHLTVRITSICSLMLLYFCCFLVSCGTIELPDEPQPSSKPRKVTIHTRSTARETVMLPIEVVAFSESGKYIAHQRINNTEEKLTLSLSEGKYRLVVFSGVGNYAFPNEGVTLNSRIEHRVLNATVAESSDYATLNAQSQAGIPLMRGEAVVEVGNKRNSVDILLGHTMSAVEFRLSQIPQNVEKVRVRLSSLYSAINWEGRYSLPSSTTLNAHRTENGDWVTPLSYIFPTTDENCVVTISFITRDEEQNYAYTLQQTLSAGTPYRFLGTFKAEDKHFSIAGNLTAADWHPTVEQHFSFGSKQSDVGNNSSNEEQPHLPSPNPSPNPSPSPSPNPNHPSPVAPSPRPIVPNTGTLAGFPQVGTLWKGKFVVASVQRITEDEADVMLLAKEQLEEVESAFSTQGNDNDATRYAKEYKEDGELDWKVPTKEEAQILASHFNGESLATLNTLLESIRATKIYYTVGKSKIRYLCDEGQYSFVFAAKPEFRKGTAKGHSFVVRLVKHIRVHKQ